jgi:transposase
MSSKTRLIYSLFKSSKSMSKVFKNFVGIDISKSWFDVALIAGNASTAAVHHQFIQSPAGYQQMSKWLQQHNIQIDDQTLFCMECTGIYNTSLVTYLVDCSAAIWVEMPLRIKKSGGFERGSDDRSASYKIALYALRYHDQAKLWKPSDASIEKIRHLIAQRDRIVTSLSHLTVPAQELIECGCVHEGKMISKMQQPAINALKKTKTKIEALISQTIKQDEELRHTVELVQSVNGIGTVTATALLVYTRSFTSFKTAKELACYCGVVPFNRTSGSSVRYKSSVSPFANMKLKKLLHLCALSAIQNDEEMKSYFERKLLEGKNKMSIINAVRNKLIHRVFAVIRDNRLYEDNYIKQCA